MQAKKTGTNRMIIGIILAVLTFWLFAQSMVNIIPAVQKDLNVSLGTLNIAISLTSLFSGLFIVAAGGISDKIGRKKLTYFGLVFSIVGCVLIIISQNASILILGRIVQGLSAACIMPSTIALVKSSFEGEDRQRALSYWSFGSWGGGGCTALVGGAIATYAGWRWIFVFSIAIALLSMYLLKDISESKAEEVSQQKFDFTGFLLFVLTMLAINMIVTRGQDFGWTSPLTVGLIAIAFVLMITFFLVERRKTNQFIDFSLFKTQAYSGAVVSNFLQNGIAATVVVANTYVQLARGFTSFQTGLLTIGNVIAVLVMIRVGEKMLQNMGARKPMLISVFVSTIGISMTAMTFLPDLAYILVVFIGFLIAGLGIGMYATPSTDTAVVNIADDKVGVASGIYKMSSSLGFSFGIAISTAVYGVIVSFASIHIAASVGILVNILFAIPAILYINKTIKSDEGIVKDTSSIPASANTISYVK
ncbi:quinolone resistance protein [Lysinibacillus contaminans]|uniref:Quinolone resistance protein n=1 Tax=Lysinibacillus contaminans TaxID=1293441 RepID=A0ABR5K0E0_9BACI|nr:MFS transporter [Lysinibacillus contaminans]KOS68243.1 quinolone resistance protein [Lysinibacillus contaminans]